MKKIKQCVVCDKEIVIYKVRLGGNNNHSKWVLLSEEGVLFLRKWFCNKCWKFIRSDL
jgi:hypothetical protein